MAKTSKLLAALDAHKGKDYKLEKQKKLQKQATKRKRSINSTPTLGRELEPNVGLQISSAPPQADTESDGWKSDESEDTAPRAVCQTLDSLQIRY